MSERLDRSLLSRIRAGGPPGRILDVPAGDGHLSGILHPEGYRVTSADLFPESLAGRPVDAVRLDMNQPLPFRDDAFDAVVSQEGIEHLEHPAGFLRECRRVLREGGSLFLTTPNIMDLSSRLAFLLTGMKSFHAGLTNEQTTLWGRDGDRLYHGHAFALPWFQLRYLIRVAGFREVRLEGIGENVAAAALARILRPVSALLLRRAYRRLAKKDGSRRRRRAPDEALQRELTEQALSVALLGHRTIFVRAVA